MAVGSRNRSGLAGPPVSSPGSAPISWLTLLVFGPAMMGLTDGCLRRTSEDQRTTTATTMAVDMTSSSTTAASHRFDCTPAEVGQAKCMHGGTCFALLLGDIRQAHCHCTAEYEGHRCQHTYIDPDIWEVSGAHMRTASIAAGLSGCILVIFTILLGVYVYCRYRRKQRLLDDQDCQASAEELYSPPLSGPASVVESLTRSSSVIHGKTSKTGPVIAGSHDSDSRGSYTRIDKNGYDADSPKNLGKDNNNLLQKNGASTYKVDVEGGRGVKCPEVVQVHDSCHHESEKGSRL